MTNCTDLEKESCLLLMNLKSKLRLPFSSTALRDATQQSWGPLGVNGGPAARSFLWRWEHVHAARHGASKHGRLKEEVPSSASAAAAAAARGAGRPKTRVNWEKVRVFVWEKERRRKGIMPGLIDQDSLGPDQGQTVPLRFWLDCHRSKAATCSCFHRSLCVNSLLSQKNV